MGHNLLDWILHLDRHLGALAAAHGTVVYLLLFAVIFIETGLVILPFLPGDSLLFVAGAFAAQGTFSLPILFPLLAAAAIAGDSANYAIGGVLRRRAIDAGRLRLIKPEHLARTQAFFDRHGPKTIVLARFVPVVRTLAPFVAALGSMPYRTFLAYNVVGGLAWVAALLGAGYLFGNIAWVHDHLTMVLLGIVALSLAPGMLAWMTGRATQENADEKNAAH
jgi:membrane-associated protein